MKRVKPNIAKGGSRPYQKPNRHRLRARDTKTGSFEWKLEMGWQSALAQRVRSKK